MTEAAQEEAGSVEEEEQSPPVEDWRRADALAAGWRRCSQARLVVRSTGKTRSSRRRVRSLGSIPAVLEWLV